MPPKSMVSKKILQAGLTLGLNVQVATLSLTILLKKKVKSKSSLSTKK